VGVDPEAPENALEIEAGAFDGRLTFFKVIWPWTRPRSADRTMVGYSYERQGVIGFALAIALLAGASWVARRNVVRGVADVRGALRLALALFALEMSAWAVEAEHVPVFVAEVFMFVTALGHAGFAALLGWIAYLALEPPIRRRYPWRIIGWTRLLSGRWRDPQVGHDLLIGVCAGSAIAAGVFLSVELAPRLGLPEMPLFIGYQSVLSGNLGSALGQALWLLSSDVRTCVTWFGLFVVAIAVLRSEWIALALLAVLIVLTNQEQQAFSLVWLAPWLNVAITVSWMLMALRVGLLATAVGYYVYLLQVATPPLFSGADWTVTNSSMLLAIPVALAAWGALHATGRAQRRELAAHAPVAP
jgi:hypothetical protein